MANFNNVCAQGEIYIRRIQAIPSNAVALVPSGDKFIVGHSETGHHHVLEREDVRLYRDPNDVLSLFAEILKPTQLTHMRDHDTHEPVNFQAGDVVHFRIAQEFGPEGWRRTID